VADSWFDRRTFHRSRWSTTQLLAAKSVADTTVSLVIPARNEAATIGEVVAGVYDQFHGSLLDEIVVIDGRSSDDTAKIATDAGATVHAIDDIRPELGSRLGKGEALWKSQFVTSGDILVFMDADLTDWHTGFVPGLLGPLLTDRSVSLVKAAYERPLREGATEVRHGGGRVTELVARPLLALHFPQLTDVIQPLAGEWAVRRDIYETLSVPAGYGVDLAAVIDVTTAHGLDALAQVELGRRAHSHQSVHQLAAMAVQLMAAVDARSGRGSKSDSAELRQFLPGGPTNAATLTEVDLTERPPAKGVGK